MVNTDLPDGVFKYVNSPFNFDTCYGTYLGLASTIKTHHNDTNLVRQMRAEGRVVEPLKDFHKDEVCGRWIQGIQKLMLGQW